MTLFLITLGTLCLCMLALGMNLVLGRASELRRGCGDDCECVRTKNADRVCDPLQKESAS